MTSLEDQLVEAGNKLLHPPSSVADLLILLEVSPIGFLVASLLGFLVDCQCIFGR